LHLCGHGATPWWSAGMSTVRVALANIRVPATPMESVLLATSAVAEAGQQGALVICFPECFVPGYRWPGTTPQPPDPVFLEQAWADVAKAARAAHITVILGTERVTDHGLQITACVINPDGTVAGWQDKGQIDPSEEATYPAMKGGGILRRCGGLCGEARKSCFTLMRMLQIAGAIAPTRSPIPPIRFTRRRYCVVQRRIHATLRQ
jgi:hypothetical protein